MKIVFHALHGRDQFIINSWIKFPQPDLMIIFYSASPVLLILANKEILIVAARLILHYQRRRRCILETDLVGMEFYLVALCTHQSAIMRGLNCSFVVKRKCQCVSFHKKSSSIELCAE